jgi:hypothetical protein
MYGSLAITQAENLLTALGTCCVGCQPSRFALPSWCGDWSNGRSSCGIQNDGEFCGYNAALSSGVQVVFDKISTAISVRGVAMDTIVTRACGDKGSDNVSMAEYCGMISKAFAIQSTLHSFESRYEDLCRSIVNDTTNSSPGRR